MWTAARVLVTREREELIAPDLGPFMRAVDLSLGSWFTVRFATPMLLKALYGCVVLGGLLRGFPRPLKPQWPRSRCSWAGTWPVWEGHRQRILLDHVKFGYTPEV